MSAVGKQVETEIAESAPVTVADPALTLAAKRLAGSASCLNCGTELQGPFCYFCGQPDRNFLRFFPALLRELMEDLVDLDSRFARTIKPLLFLPGRLTRDFMEGRRFRYSPPMRLYIFSSILFFLVAAALSDGVTISTDRTTADGDQIIALTTREEAKARVEERLAARTDGGPEALTESQTKAIEEAIDGVIDEEADAGDDWLESGTFQFNGQPWDKESNPLVLPLVPDAINNMLNYEIEHSAEKAKQINENPNLIIDKVFDILPGTMFVLLPITALIFKFWYLFARRYYLEHLIFSLHNHTFLFVSLTLVILLNELSDLLVGRGHSLTASAAEWMAVAIWVWIPIYLLIALHVVYRQNWFLTIGKYFVIGFSYLMLLGIVTTGVAIAGFVLL